jgi:hypothetical protein
MFARLVGVTGFVMKHPHVPTAKRTQQQRTAGPKQPARGGC